jgi:hypothetical protein
MAATPGQMNIDDTAGGTEAIARATGFMLIRLGTGNGIMQISEPANVGGLMKTESFAANGFMLLNVSA